jgi:hypothetical protein
MTYDLWILVFLVWVVLALCAWSLVRINFNGGEE